MLDQRGSHRSGGRVLRRLQGPTRALFWRLVVINGVVFATGTLVLALSPATVSSPVLLTEAPVLIIGLGVIVTVNAVLVRSSLVPLDALDVLRRRVDLLRTGDRLTDPDSAGLIHLTSTLNAMLDRLEAEHYAASAHALAAQEAERERIARELHDEIGQGLTVALLALKPAIDHAPARLQHELRTPQEAIRGCLDQVGQVARRLRPGVLADLGLQSALTELCTEFSRISGVPVTRRVDAELPTLGKDTELVLYRIAQESLTNVARHAVASTAELCLTARTDRGVSLCIIDDGRGGVETEGAGILGMRERALLVGAQLSITSSPAEGTQVRLDVPPPAQPG